jgi:hypothetical protein
MLPSNPMPQTQSHPLALTRTVLPAASDTAAAMAQAGVALLRWPFDAARMQYAGGVHAGLFERSMLAARDFEGALGALERLTLGPLARYR